MHIKDFYRSSSMFSRRVATVWVLLSLIVCNTNVVLADFLAVGDVSGTVNEAGGATGDLIIGDTGTGGLLADGVAPLIGTLAALESDSVIIGNQPGSIGAANIEDFIDGGNWLISGDLIVGNAGLGLLDFLNASTIGDAPTAAIGGTTYVGGSIDENGTPTAAPALDTNSSLGEGVLRINGLGSRLSTEKLIVGGEGIGLIEASGRSFLNTNLEAFIGSTETTGDGTISLSDLGTRWTANAPVTVGGLATSSSELSHGKVVIANQAVFQVDGVTTPGPSGAGTLTINPRGRVELAGGILRMLPQASGNIIDNNGIISGDGFINGGIDIGAVGELRNAAGVANTREYLLVSEAVTNDGTIQSLGGSMEFESLVTNTREIIARDAEMHFRGGLDNAGTISIGGNTTLHGNINSAGSIFVLSDSESLIVGDLTFSASSVLALTVGEDAGTLDVTGSADLTNAIVALDYSAGVASQPGDSYQIFQAAGGILGTFPSTAAADGQIWNISLVGGDTLIATQSGIAAVPFGSDLNGDGSVNALDIGIWRSNYPIASGAPKNLGDADGDGDVDASDFMKIQRDFGIIPVPPITANTAAVPEPSTLALALLTLACCPRRRRRS